MPPDNADIGRRVRDARKLAGLTQQELATRSGVSRSLIKKLEQGAYPDDLRLETMHSLARTLAVTTSSLRTTPDAPEPDPDSSAMWDATRQALRGSHGPADDEPTIGGVRDALNDLTDAYLASRYADLSQALPLLLRDASELAAMTTSGARARALQVRSQTRSLAAHVLCMAWQFDAGDEAADLAMKDAGDQATMLVAVHARSFALLRQGRLAEVADLSARWAEAAEPDRISRATPDDLASWGRLLVTVSTAAVRDNRPDDAREALRLARTAAVAIGKEYVPPAEPWSVFGPATVAMIGAEHAMIQGRPEATLTVGKRVTGDGFPILRYFHRHRLDVARALAATRKRDEAVAVLGQLRAAAPQWLACQRYASDILAEIIERRRTLSDDMRDLAGFLHLPN